MTLAAQAPARPAAETATRILDAAFACIQDVGLSRTTVEDVAHRAGLARQTIYRYFPSKDSLIMALVLREEERFLDGVRAAFAATGDLERAIHEGLVFCLRFAREHPLLDRLLATDPEVLLPYLTIRAAPVIDRARTAVAELLRMAPRVRSEDAEAMADALVRFVLSCTLTPPPDPPERIARRLARILTAGLGAPSRR